jgi:hypothetical protein
MVKSKALDGCLFVAEGRQKSERKLGCIEGLASEIRYRGLDFYSVHRVVRSDRAGRGRNECVDLVMVF